METPLTGSVRRLRLDQSQRCKVVPSRRRINQSTSALVCLATDSRATVIDDSFRRYRLAFEANPNARPIVSITLTEFARTRLFPRTPRQNTIQDCTPEAFEQRLNEVEPVCVLDGYAPFCKLHVQRNWTSTRCFALPITDDNRDRLCSAYEARTSTELPVLVRWFEGVEAPIANYLIAILYSREQLALEGTGIDNEWGVVGCLYTMDPEEIPMAPITIMRNALGVNEGGSGVPLDPAAYRRSVAFWDAHANWRGAG